MNDIIQFKQSIIAIAMVGLCSAGCGQKTTEAPETTSTPPADEPAEPADPEPEPDPETERPSLSRADCEAKGGKIVGDIGDGAIHRPDYVCESGQPPIGTIMPGPDEPIAAEGEVCCN